MNRLEPLQYQFKSSIGSLYLVADQQGLQGVYFDKQKFKTVRDLKGVTSEAKMLGKTAKQLEEYFSGKRKSFDLSFNLSGTPFQKKVWQELFKIPYGKTVSYKDIAQKINNPKAVRAVGSANGKNPVCVIIPCHRVIAADGTIGGYSGGLQIKKKLLKHEGQSHF